MTDLTLKQLSDALFAEVNVGIAAKTANIVERAAVETRLGWKKAADEFPSPAKSREHDYAIGFDDLEHTGPEVTVEIGSNDPLLAVIENGSATHAPHGYGKAAAEKASKGIVRALARIDPFRRAT